MGTVKVGEYELEWLEGLEPRRGCGYRYVGKLYLVGAGIPITCHRLPIELPEACPTCGWELKQHRGIQKIDFERIFGKCEELDKDYECHPHCPVCNPPKKGYLMWVGTKYYQRTIDFIEEADRLGVSKAIASIPKDFEVGKDWVYLAHPKAVWKSRKNKDTLTGKEEYSVAGIFYVFRPIRVEVLVKESDATEEKIKKLVERGITPILVPDNYDDMVEAVKKKKRKKKRIKKDENLATLDSFQ